MTRVNDDDESPMAAPDDLLSGLDPAFAREFEANLATRFLAGGKTLCREGDEPDGLAIVTRGRLAVLGDDGHTIEVLARGDVFGEIGALSGRPRTRTVIAARDTELKAITQDQFELLIAEHPDIGRALTRLVVTRLTRPQTGASSTRVPSTLTLLRADESIDPKPLIAAFERLADRTSIITADDLVGHSDSERLERLDRRERDHDLTILDAGVVGADGPWMQWCTRQADDVMVLVPAGSGPNRFPAIHPYVASLHERRCIAELVVVNRAAAEFPIDASTWRSAVEPDRLHHLRDGDDGSADRVARLVLGRGIGLALSGGGAKGLAHIGAWRAINELGIEIDAVSGVSFGALMAAGIALDYSADELHDMVTERLIEKRSIFDVTLPVVSVLRGAGVSEELKDVGNGRTFDQVWRPFLCSSCDLSSGTLVDHDRGPLWKAVRASLSIPGVFPPIRDGERLLVDGAVLDNLPINSIRNAHPSPMKVIAVDVGKDSGLTAGRTPEDGAVSGWSQLRRRILRRPSSGVPNMGQIMMRVVELAGTDSGGVADTYIRPDLSGLGIGDLSEMKAFEEAGYEAAIQALS